MSETNPRLTQTVKAAGWAAKLGPGDLSAALCGLPLRADPNLIVGMERLDDAGVYRLTDEVALIQTIDYFTPIVDDPYAFGQIAVANALSDVYAMGGRPITAMNVVCFPLKTMDIAVLREILRGGLEKMNEAAVTLVGGHSVEDPELKYGLSVTGIIHPDRILTKGGARPGDKLVLTKPLGTGIISTALKGGAADEAALAESLKSMTALNDAGSRLAQGLGAHACTDITGFGLLGHALEMAELSQVKMVVEWSAVPLLPGVEKLASMGFIPGGAHRNRDFRAAQLKLDEGLPDYVCDILFDPQTSGGLLISMPADKADRLVQGLHQEGVSTATVIGWVEKGPGAMISVR